VALEILSTLTKFSTNCLTVSATKQWYEEPVFAGKNYKDIKINSKSVGK